MPPLNARVVNPRMLFDDTSANQWGMSTERHNYFITPAAVASSLHATRESMAFCLLSHTIRPYCSLFKNGKLCSSKNSLKRRCRAGLLLSMSSFMCLLIPQTLADEQAKLPTAKSQREVDCDFPDHVPPCVPGASPALLTCLRCLSSRHLSQPWRRQRECQPTAPNSRG